MEDAATYSDYAVDLHLHRRMKKLFHASEESLDSFMLAKKSRKEGFSISHEHMRKLM